MKLTIYTRSYIKSNGDWDLSYETINSVIKILNMTKDVRWVILVSNYHPGKYQSIKDKYDALTKYGNVSFNFVGGRLSCSEARVSIYKFLDKNSEDQFRCGYFMNLDSDDELINQKKLVELLSHDELMDNDLIGFGLEVPKNNPMHKTWTWNKHKFRYSRRYITTNTQTMFLFLHRFWVISRVLSAHLSYFTTYPVNHPNESCDDTLLCLEMASIRTTLTISAVCANFIKYNIHEGQVSENQTSEYKEELGKELKKLGYLYVNSHFYKYRLGNLIQYTPEKPKGIYKLINILFLK
jgi:hypothetical protein